jgi:hypothetical protein
MPKRRTEPLGSEPVILVVLPDVVARQIHRKLQRLDQELDEPPRPRRAAPPSRRRRLPEETTA